MGRSGTLEGGPLTIVVGELLLVACSVCYLVWWTLAYRPAGRTSGGGGLFLVGAVLTGLCGIVALAVGIARLLPSASWLALGATVVGGVVVGALLLYLTSGPARRPVTTELPLIVLWGTTQVAAGLALWTAGVLKAPAGIGWVVLTAVATLVGLGCYLVFYRLEPAVAYRVGMVPLAVDGAVALLLTAIVTFGRAP